MYEVEQNIPVCQRVYYTDKSLRLPLDKMEVGDSFLVPWMDIYGKCRTVLSFRDRVSYLTRMIGIKTTYRTTPKGVRVWRIK